MLSMKVWWRFGAARDPFPSLCCGVYRRCAPLDSVSGSSSFSLDAIVSSKPPASSVMLAGNQQWRFQRQPLSSSKDSPPEVRCATVLAPRGLTKRFVAIVYT